MVTGPLWTETVKVNSLWCCCTGLLTRSCPCATKMQKQNPFCGKHSIQSRRNLGARGAFAPSDFGRSFNLIPIRESRLCPTYFYWPPRNFRPSYGPAILSSLCAARATSWKMVVKDFHLLFSVKILDLLRSVCVYHWIVFGWKLGFQLILLFLLYKY